MHFSIGERSPRAPQPDRIITPLKPHQLACVQRGVDMERQINRNDQKSFMCNMGSIADRRGTGVMLTALAIVAANRLDNIHVCAPRLPTVVESGVLNRQRVMSSLVLRVPCISPNETYVFMNSVVVGATAIVTQNEHHWYKEIVTRTRLNCLSITNAGAWFKLKTPTINEFIRTVDAKKIDVVIVSRSVVRYMLAAGVKGFTRVIYDAHLRASDVVNRKTFTEFDFMWTVSDRTCPNLFDTQMDVASEIMIRTEPLFMAASIANPEIVTLGYVCRLRCTGFGVLATLYDIYHRYPGLKLFPHMGDIRDAFRILGWSDKTVEHVARSSAQQWLPDKLARLSENDCGVCHSAYNNPVLLPCGHVFCGSCLLTWLQSSPPWKAWINIYPPAETFKISCPECRNEVSGAEVCSLVDDGPEPPPVYSEEEAVRIIGRDRSRKYIIVYKHYADSDLPRLLDAAGVDFSEIKRYCHANLKTASVDNLKRSTSARPNVLLVASDESLKHYDLSFVTDLIMFNGPPPTDANNAIIRAAQCIGRKDALVVHHIRPPYINGAAVPVTYKHLYPSYFRIGHIRHSNPSPPAESAIYDEDEDFDLYGIPIREPLI